MSDYARGKMSGQSCSMLRQACAPWFGSLWRCQRGLRLRGVKQMAKESGACFCHSSC